MINFIGPLVVVEDEQKSKLFYEELLNQKLSLDLGACQQFESGLTLQRKSSMTEIFSIPQQLIIMKSNSIILYFETENFDGFIENLCRHNVERLNDVVEYDWGQRSISFYDPDGHVIDVSETMQAVCKKFSAQGMSIAEISQRTEHPIDFVKTCIDK